MEAVLAGHDRAVFVCGIARNQDELWDLFDRVFLLRIDGPTQESRLAAYDAQHPPGRSEAGRNQIREGRTVFETQMLRAGAIALDGTAPTAMVADELISLANLHRCVAIRVTAGERLRRLGRATEQPVLYSSPGQPEEGPWAYLTADPPRLLLPAIVTQCDWRSGVGAS